MDPKRWREIERIFQAALERASSAREAFLKAECRDDDELRSEIKALLDRASGAKAFLDGPALDVASQTLSGTVSPSLTDLRLGPYIVQAQLGAGGMGVVYRAIDTKLNRPVAIKFLSDHLAGAAAHQRFQREARTASSLNHPHIVTVHDAGEFDGRRYLVTELVDGGTLRDWIRGQHGWRETVELLTGVADGLAAAHDAGVLHRDVKPENILITKSGYAKLADFGLAKVYEGVTAAAGSAATDARTQPGIIPGTVAYMSPEQASGLALDTRSDIFSFGVVLFEALAEQRPFTGAFAPDVLYAIVHQGLPPLPEHVPPAARVILEKALQKDPAERFQTMHDLVGELRRVLHQGTETSQASPPIDRSRPQRRWRVASLVALVLALAAVGALLTPRLRQPAAPATPEYVQLTNFADSAVSPALSPDGRMLTFIRGEKTLSSLGQIYIKFLPDGDPVQLTNDNYRKMSPKFTPDGTSISYSTAIGSSADHEGEATMDTWVVPVLGGPPRRLLTNAEGPTWFVDDTGQPRLLFSTLTGRDYQMSIVTSTESRAGERNVYVPPTTGMAHRSFLSPDRNWVLVVEMASGKWLPCRLVPFDGSSPGRPVGPAPSQCTDAAWSPDGRWMYLSTNTGNGVHTWRQRFPDGTPEQVTFGVTQEEGIHFAPDGRSFVTSIGTSQSTVWIHDARGDRQMTSEGYGFQPSISPDGKTLYYLVRGSSTMSFMAGSLWAVDRQSGERYRLLPDFRMRQFSISGDGQRVVFVAEEHGEVAVWLASLNGRMTPRRLVTANGGGAYFGAAGEVVFEAEEEGTIFVYRIKDDGRDLKKVIPTRGLISFAVSPDGRWISAQDSRAWGSLFVFPTGGGSPTLICSHCSPPHGPNPIPPDLSWSPDGRFLYLKFNASLYEVPLQAGQMLPTVPASGFQSKEAVAALPGARLISEDDSAYPGPDPSIYAFTKVTTQRNIYSVSVP
jgi:eukaryotic-like serine/threonine-protein kinase